MLKQDKYSEILTFVKEKGLYKLIKRELKIIFCSLIHEGNFIDYQKIALPEIKRKIVRLNIRNNICCSKKEIEEAKKENELILNKDIRVLKDYMKVLTEEVAFIEKELNKVIYKDIFKEFERKCLVILPISRFLISILNLEKYVMTEAIKILKDKLPKLTDYNEILMILSNPVKDDRLTSFNKDLINIAILKNRNKSAFNKKFKEFYQNFSSINIRYGFGNYLSEEEMLQKINDIKNPEEINKINEQRDKQKKINRINLLKKLDPDVRETIIFKSLAHFTAYRSMRADIYDLWLDSTKSILNKISEERKISYDDLLNYGWREILNKKTINAEELNKRKNGEFMCVYWNDCFVILTDKEKLDKIENIINKIETNITQFKGMTAQKAKKIRGSVKIISSFNEISSFAKDSILVTVMTAPNYISAMKKAKAIITDEGGITCHAAIISRELNIPCIIGTKIATKVLKDGDEVELDFEKGIVKKIKKYQ